MKQIFVKPNEQFKVMDNGNIEFNCTNEFTIRQGNIWQFELECNIEQLSNCQVRLHLDIDNDSKSKGLMVIGNILDLTPQMTVTLYASTTDIDTKDIKFIMIPLEIVNFRALDVPEDVRVF